MRFEVIRDGKVVMWTEDVSCIPDKDTLAQMKKAGYKLRQDKKPYPIKAGQR